VAGIVAARRAVRRHARRRGRRERLACACACACACVCVCVCVCVVCMACRVCAAGRGARARGVWALASAAHTLGRHAARAARTRLAAHVAAVLLQLRGVLAQCGEQPDEVVGAHGAAGVCVGAWVRDGG
jgi:hypothetical protein